MPNDLLLTDAAQAAIQTMPVFQEERAKSLVDGWQRYVCIGRIAVDGAILFMNAPTLTTSPARQLVEPTPTVASGRSSSGLP